MILYITLQVAWLALATVCDHLKSEWRQKGVQRTSRGMLVMEGGPIFFEIHFHTKS